MIVRFVSLVCNFTCGCLLVRLRFWLIFRGFWGGLLRWWFLRNRLLGVCLGCDRVVRLRLQRVELVRLKLGWWVNLLGRLAEAWLVPMFRRKSKQVESSLLVHIWVGVGGASPVRIRVKLVRCKIPPVAHWRTHISVHTRMCLCHIAVHWLLEAIAIICTVLIRSLLSDWGLWFVDTSLALSDLLLDAMFDLFSARPSIETGLE